MSHYLVNDYLMLFIGLCLLSFCISLKYFRKKGAIAMVCFLIAGALILIIGTVGVIEKLMLH